MWAAARSWSAWSSGAPHSLHPSSNGMTHMRWLARVVGVGACRCVGGDAAVVEGGWSGRFDRVVAQLQGQQVGGWGLLGRGWVLWNGKRGCLTVVKTTRSGALTPAQMTMR